MVAHPSQIRPEFLPSLLVWEPPVFTVHEFMPRRTKFCFIVVVFNEGERIRQQLREMQARASAADIIVADGNSTDGSLTAELLGQCRVRALIQTAERGLSAATRMAIAYALAEQYEGVVFVDGNGKDGVAAIDDFLAELEQQVDFVQGSRFLDGGTHQNTPIERYLGIRCIMAPLLWFGCGFYYTDPTNAFRAFSRSFLLDPRVQPIRQIFVRFNLQWYLSYRAAKLGYRVKEIPVTRCYPADGTVPTKITSYRTKFLILWQMLLTIVGAYNPRR
jgi:dolichol-phosphate mannosyltransferase